MKGEGKANGISKLMPIVLYYIGFDFILLDPLIPETFCSKHDVRAFLIIIFITNPNVFIL